MAPSVFVPAVFYKDPRAALTWLEQAFGFETTTLVTDAEGNVGHAEMSFLGGQVQVGGEWESPEIAGEARMRSPASVEGINTQFIRIHMDEGLDAHCATARAAGARILAAPEDQFYGARVYRAMDPEGHVWTFSQEGAAPSIGEMEARSGLKIRSSLKED
ncbi:MAG: VOC family protein [Alphaproteobacteria bacterium]|nr:VOC family protein [Alphaproteobacteria bacterium]MBU1512631.1 VOC family protein [Alphaproteobacteria bacterium]MBU2095025.1 VOC family protein [Alphaproteobacteria bacterium]MBU2151856.1 VOC family protein [Alphaproteobacteria bacterium]MBU2306255.1 VOC family protein [Alphaproteobacteria bacterium]